MRSTKTGPRPTVEQVRVTKLVVEWYLANHYGKSLDPGTRGMYYDRQRVGHLAVRPGDLRKGLPGTLFRVLIATAMFQRQRDAQVMRILRELPYSTAREIGALRRLQELSAASPCPHLKSNDALTTKCDLAKDPATKLGTCAEYPELSCHLKEHTVALRRYGHFGKVPTSAALVLAEGCEGDLRELYTATLLRASSPSDASTQLEEALSRSWRVSQKIACMFLSVVSNPDLGDSNAPWTFGLDWNSFVVVDSNVDLFLGKLGYSGVGTYDARRAFVQALAQRIDLAGMQEGLSSYNARLVQQAMYLFMSASNRRELTSDCMKRQELCCPSCPSKLRALCPVQLPSGGSG